jgi:branched-chain amino acid transport system permease protein
VSIALQIVVSGLAAGGVYGLLGAGLSLVYRLTGVVHFALGELVGLGVFVTLLVAAGSGPVAQTGIGGARFAVALAVGVVACVAAGAATYLVAVQPYLERRSTFGWVAATLAVAFAVHAALEAGFGRPAYVFPDPLPFRRLGHGGFVTVGGAEIELRAFFVVGISLLLAAAASLLLTRSRAGRGLRAIVDDPEGARIVGVPSELLVGAAFSLAGGVAALAAIAAAPSAPFGADTGSLLGVKGLVAALVVGFRSPLSAFAAGLAVGVVESTVSNASIAGHGLGPQYAGAIVVALALAALLPHRALRQEVVE